MCKAHFSLAWEALTLSQPQQTLAFTPTHSCLWPKTGKQVVPSVGLGHRGRPPPWSPAGLGSGCCGCFQLPGAMRAGRGSCSHPVVIRWGRGNWALSFKRALPSSRSASAPASSSSSSGQAGQRAAGRVEDRGLCLGVTPGC